MTEQEYQEAVRRGNEAMSVKPGIFDSWSDFFKCLGYAAVCGLVGWWGLYLLLTLCGS